MGGEPFMNPDLGAFIFAVRRVFPYCDLRVVSNGLLIPRGGDNTIKAIRECGAVIDISQYPPTRDNIESIMSFCEEKQIKINMGKPVNKFFKQIRAAGSQRSCDKLIQKTYEGCWSKHCHFLRGSNLYCCPAVILYYENREFLELEISEEVVRRNSFDLINGHENGWEMLRILLQPFEFCQFCGENMEWFDWEVSNKRVEKEDWLVI